MLGLIWLKASGLDLRVWVRVRVTETGRARVTLPAPIGPHVYTIHGRGCGSVRETTDSMAPSWLGLRIRVRVRVRVRPRLRMRVRLDGTVLVRFKLRVRDVVRLRGCCSSRLRMWSTVLPQLPLAGIV